MKRFTTMLALVAFLSTLTAFASHATTAPKAKPQVQASGAAAPAPAAAKHAVAKKTMAAAKEMLDINTASKEELMKLPGVGDAIADKIVAGRPFKTKYELLQKGLVNRTTYAKIRPMIVAKQAAAAK